MQSTILRKKAGGNAPPERKPGRRLTVRRGAALLLVLALAAGAALGRKTLLFSGEEQTLPTEQTTYDSLSTTLSGTGTTMLTDSVMYTIASKAEITGVYVSAGDTVEVGDLLYTQDDSELDNQTEEYQDRITEQENQLDDYQEQLAQLQEEITALTVITPFAGRITDVAMDVGDNMAARTKPAILVGDSQMCLTQYFSYAYEDQVYVGMKAGVSMASLMLNQEGTVTGVQIVDRVTTEGTHCFAVAVTLDSPGAFIEGMAGAGYLVADPGEKLYPSVEGELEYRRSQDLAAEVGGEVTGIGAVDYEQVSAGAVLVQFDGADYQKQVESMNKQITQIQEKIVQLQEKIAEAEEKRSDHAVTAELAGKIIMVNVWGGESPREAGQTTVVFYNLDFMAITANIDELNINGIAMGMEVDTTQSGAESGTHHTGIVMEISYEATDSNDMGGGMPGGDPMGREGGFCTSLVQLKDVYKIHGEGQENQVNALNGVTLSTDQGEFVAIIGTSGSDKSATMNILGCLDVPTWGEYLLDGTPIRERTQRELFQIRSRQIAFIFQSYSLIPSLNVWQNVALPMLYQRAPLAERRARAMEALEKVGIAARADNWSAQLSGGQRQRMVIARAIAACSPILMADEPTRALGSRIGEQVLGLMRQMNAEGTTVIPIARDNGITAQADRTVRVGDERIVYDSLWDGALVGWSAPLARVAP